MISRIKETSKTILTKNNEIKTLYTCYDYRTHSTLFKYATSFEEAKEKFSKHFNISNESATVLKYPSLDILLNNNFIIIH